jgi:hypothetical protein
VVAVVSSTAASVSNRNEHANTLDTHKTRLTVLLKLYSFALNLLRLK